MKIQDYTRRDFLRKITNITLASFGMGAMIRPSNLINYSDLWANRKYTILKKNNVILFQGDSITDFERDRKVMGPNDHSGLGPGYSFIAASNLLYDDPKLQLSCYNRGISGNKVFQLADRWQKDTLSLKPNVLSILVGVNDYWHTIVHNYQGTVKTYNDDYRMLLKRTKKALPDVRLIIGEPYALKGGSKVDSSWNLQAFKKYQATARQIAKDFGAAFIPYQSIYDKAIKQAPADYWTRDGVHPSVAGCKLMSKAWLTTLQEMRL